ncbi:MAG: dihydropteroate synthase [Candidatus Aminicenantes bacterium]|nr:MAG: dihydropteroate synthase [Candidatus Aminicenantes bacterium]
MRKESTLQINGKDYTLGQRTWIAGVINVTPDSFSDGALYIDRDKATERGVELVSEGSDIIDIGGESTRPGSESVSVEEELNRVVPVISALRKKTDIPISIDTTKPEVAEAALNAGADIINDISSLLFDPRMGPLAARMDVPVILMHMKGTPKTMQLNPSYENVTFELKAFLKERLETAEAHGIKKEKLIIDPGIGFGKRFEDNLTLINNLSSLEELGRPVLVGISRKSFIGRILNVPPQERLEGTIASAILSIANGAHILRVHDVASVKKAILVAEAIMNENLPLSLFEEGEDRKRSYVF